jgi:hypothetical protein
MEKRKRGRPKGTSDKNSPQRSLLLPTTNYLSTKRPRGNPNWGKGKRNAQTSLEVVPLKKPLFRNTLAEYAEKLAAAAAEAQKASEDASQKDINKRENIITDNRFQNGNHASPGRPKGSKNKSTLMLEAIGLENATSVYQKLVDLALGRTKEGDVTACKIILDRVNPVKKGNKYSLDYFGETKTIKDINALSEHVVNLVIQGEISLEEAEEYGRILEQRLKMITDTDIAVKIQETCEKVDMIKNGR